MGNLLHLTSQAAHCFEYFPMVHGIFLFYCYWICKDKTDGTNADTEFGDTNTGKSCKKLELSPFYCMTVVLVLFVEFIIHLGISMLPPIFLISWKEDNVVFYNESPKEGNAYAALAFIDHFYAFLIRSAMALITLFVRLEWNNAVEYINEIKVKVVKRTDLNETLEECEIVTTMQILTDVYHSTGERVNAVQNILQGWFVIKWMVYFINIAGHSILTVEILLDDKRGDEYEKHKLIFVTTQLAYNFFAFFFLFVCGSLMNRYHTNYRKCLESLQRKCLSKSHNNYMLLLQSTNTLISEIPEYQFLPTIFSIDFPLNSPGYTLTMLLALFVFIANFVTQYS